MHLPKNGKQSDILNIAIKEYVTYIYMEATVRYKYEPDLRIETIYTSK